ncbi:hypothetical protein [Flavobacterium sangjuense]|uniref:Uncharacterized protein n=1 Tax=Flavobacterium sangjuense TaxID=2518177 RepID=A0A4P7PVH5_9FLAO|nr:hypothetical protein [Flavobacterium sangjuense]QBZ98989.1 hypothetical protein GS03_02501 [Flavobacterium sangjuense]
MKTITKITSIVAFLFLIIPEVTSAQGPPPWAPAHGYRAKTRHVYFPQYNMYYDMNRGSYLYLNGGRWSVSATLPNIYVGVNLGSTAQIQLNYMGYDPYRYNDVHVVEYRQYCNERHYDDDDYRHNHKHWKKHKKHKKYDD